MHLGETQSVHAHPSMLILIVSSSGPQSRRSAFGSSEPLRKTLKDVDLDPRHHGNFLWRSLWVCDSNLNVVLPHQNKFSIGQRFQYRK